VNNETFWKLFKLNYLEPSEPINLRKNIGRRRVATQVRQTQSYICTRLK